MTLAINRRSIQSAGILGMVSSGQLVYFDGSRPIQYYESVTETYYTCPPSCGGGGPGGGGGQFKEIYDPTDPEQYEQLQSKNLDEVFDAMDPKLQTQMVGGGGAECACVEEEHTRIVYDLERTIIYGTQYIDEQAVRIDQGPYNVSYVLTDANYNVTGLASSTAWQRQYSYKPYGNLYAAEKRNGSLAQSVNLTDPSITNLYNHNFRNGMERDFEIKMDHSRNRPYDYYDGRFISVDKNGQALALQTVMLRNAQTPMAFASLSMHAQYGDGMNSYQYVRSNPITGFDPTGLYEEIDDYIAELKGHKVAALGFIQGGAGFALMAMDTTLQLAGSILGVDLINSFSNVITGNAEFSDYIAIGATVLAPGVAYGAFKGYKWLRRFFSRSARSQRKASKLIPRFGSLPKPVVSNYDPKLNNAIEAAYSGLRQLPENRFGTGSVADAIRHTKASGDLVKGTDHVMKGNQLIIRFERYLRRSPRAPAQDKKAALMIIDDLKDALGIQYGK